MSWLGTILAAQEGGTFWFPPQSSTVAKDVDWLYFYIYWLCLLFFFIIMIMAGYFVVKYRHRPGGPKADHTFTHSTFLELFWSVIPACLMVPMFYWGFTGYIDLRTPPAGAYQIRVEAKKWNWTFYYPNGGISDKLLAPKDQPIVLTMSSEDVIHSLFIPAFRVKQDVVPGRFTQLWFNANTAGTYDLFCTEYCGTRHSDMITKCIIFNSVAEFQTELEKLDQPGEGQSQADWGKVLYTRFGCHNCHAVDDSGKPDIGPKFKIDATHGFGSTRELADGTKQLMDENYIQESLLNPAAKVRKPYSPVMPAQTRLKQKHINALIEYLKTLK